MNKVSAAKEGVVSSPSQSIGMEKSVLVEATEKMKNIELKQMADHLEFLGYQIKRIELDNGKELVTAVHPTNNNFMFFDLMTGFTLFRVNLSTEKRYEAEMDKAINRVNQDLGLSKIYYEMEDDIVVLRIEAVYVGEYKKERFGSFYELFENDQKRIFQLDASKVFLRD